MKNKVFRGITVLTLSLLLLTAAALASGSHDCVDTDGDHLCDECWESLTALCSDQDGDHCCDVCWRPVTVACADEDGDEWCDVCGGHLLQYCKDADKNHACDTCWAVLSNCLDENKDHLCDLCGGVFWVDENADGMCDGCDAVLTHVTAEHVAVYYHEDKGATLADVVLQITVEPYVGDVGSPAGTVVVRWTDADGNSYSTADKALTFGTTTVTVEYPSLPMSALESGGRVTFTPYDAGFTPAENGCVAEYDLPTLWVGSDAEYTVNGVKEHKLYLHPGAGVTVVQQPGLTERWEWVFEEGYNLPEMTIDGLVTTFVMPEEDVNIHGAWRCEVCTDADGDNWCDVCEYHVEDPIYVGGVELTDGWYLSNDGTLSATTPAGGYAHFKGGVLTLNGYEYEGAGKQFEGTYAAGGETYVQNVLVYSKGDLTVHVEDDSTLVNTAEAGTNAYSQGISAADLIVTGGRLTVTAGGEAIFAEHVAAQDAELNLNAPVGIYSDATGIYEEKDDIFGDAVYIGNSTVNITADDGIYAYAGDISLYESDLNITGKYTGIYAYGGGVNLDYSDVTVSAGDEAVFARTGLTLGDGHTVLTPEGGTVTELTAHAGTEKESTYSTVVDAAGVKATAVRIHYAAPSTDVEEGAWYADAVEYVLTRDLMDGVEEYYFAPAGEATRADFIQALWKMAGSPVVNYLMLYEDVNQEETYAEAVRWASAMGIAKGYPDGTFRPDQAISRQEMATFLYRYVQLQGDGFAGMWMFLLDCTDRADVAEWAYEPLCWLTMKGVMQGDGTGALKPQATATRAEMAQILKNYTELDD